MRPSRRTVAIVAGVVLALTGGSVALAAGGNDPIACTATPTEDGHLLVDCPLPIPQPSTVTETVVSPSPVVTTVTSTVTQTVTVTPSQTASPTPSASPSATTSPSARPKGSVASAIEMVMPAPCSRAQPQPSGPKPS